MEPIEFKYHAVDASGNLTGFFASRGRLTEDSLVLDGVNLPLNCIYQVVNRYDRLTLVYASDKGQAVTFTFAPKGGLDRKLKLTIDRLCSYRWAEERYRSLEREGKGAAFRTAKCPACTSVVDLTGFADTPQFYCPYCQEILPDGHEIATVAANYQLCDRCGFYSFPIRYTTIYVVLNVISWRNHFSCHVCMRWECWKMLAINLLPPFVGELFAIFNTIRAYGAGITDTYLPELVGANALAHKGRADEAVALYEAMLTRVPVHAGIRYNLALAYGTAGAWAECLEAARLTLRDCSNYVPAGTLIAQALKQLNRADESEQFAKSWGMVAVKDPPAPADAERIQRRGSDGAHGTFREALPDDPSPSDN